MMRLFKKNGKKVSVLKFYFFRKFAHTHTNVPLVGGGGDGRPTSKQSGKQGMHNQFNFDNFFFLSIDSLIQSGISQNARTQSLFPGNSQLNFNLFYTQSTKSKNNNKQTYKPGGDSFIWIIKSN